MQSKEQDLNNFPVVQRTPMAVVLMFHLLLAPYRILDVNNYHTTLVLFHQYHTDFLILVTVYRDPRYRRQHSGQVLNTAVILCSSIDHRISLVNLTNDVSQL